MNFTSALLETDMKALRTESLQPLLIDVFNFKRFAGRYYLTSIVCKVDSNGQPCKVLTIADASTEMKIFCSNEELIQIDLRPDSLIHVEAALKQNMGSAYFLCKNIQQLNKSQSQGLDLACLPRSKCPKPEVFDAFLVFVGRIQNPLIKRFLTNVLLQEDIGVRYLQCPASIKHHHSYPGGLIEHSVEMVWDISGIQELSPLEKDIAVVSSLLHDIGKTRTYTPDGNYTAVGRLVDHQQLTLEICSNALKELELSSPHISNMLRHAWTCYSPKARFGFRPKTRVARYLQRVDGFSAKHSYRENHLPVFSDMDNRIRALSFV